MRMKMKRFLMLSILPCVLSCGDKEPEDTGSLETDTDTDTDTDGDGPCEDVDSQHYEVLYTGRAYVDDMWNLTELTIADQASWDSFVAGFSFGNLSDTFTRDTFDWSIEKVAVASVYVGSTCGLSLTAADSCPIDGQPLLYLEVEDSSAGCDSVCDADDQVVHVIVVDAGADPQYTVNVTDGCE